MFVKVSVIANKRPYLLSLVPKQSPRGPAAPLPERQINSPGQRLRTYAFAAPPLAAARVPQELIFHTLNVDAMDDHMLANRSLH